MKMRKQNLEKQRGAVSIFVVIFAALFFTAITVGFMMLMLGDQNRSTDNNLAKNALDSANAGVEDAKRVLAKYNDCIARNDLSGDCNKVKASIAANSCATIQDAVTPGSAAAGGKSVAQGTVGEDMQQAYTCVKITTDTDDVTGKLKDEGEVAVIPLRPTSGQVQSVKVQWIEAASGALAPTPSATDRPAGLLTPYLPSKADWTTVGSVLRAQVIGYNTGEFKPHEVDNGTRTVFLYPGNDTTPNIIDMNIDAHTTAYTDTDDINTATDFAYNEPKKVKCLPTSSLDGFRCEAILNITAKDRGYLALAGMYKATQYRVTIYSGSNGTGPLKFNNVQPSVDSTGRANDVYKRISARVNAGDASDKGLYPRAALGARGSICKDYTITDFSSGDVASEFDKGSSGTPACPDVTKNDFTP
jgi:Tfp pilus assembly protein PilX